ncbi:MAG: hypothetical protein ACRD1X_09275 [Vicinamibacteria bacterium]
MSVRRVAVWVLIVSATSSGEVAAADLRPKTLDAWERYILRTEARIGAEVESGEGFLARDFLPADEARECQQTIWSGGVCVYPMQTLDASGGEFSVPHGMVHHWLGSALIPDVSLDELLRWLQDYPKHEERFRDVEVSRLLSREGDRFEIFLRLRQDSIVAVRFNTEHVVEYRRHGPREASSRSVATRIAQLENPGEPQERERSEGHDSGFLWRLNSYWRFQEVAEGVVVECESVALSRSIPFALRWLVLPFTASIPRESLESTLLSIRKGSAATWMTVRAEEGARTPSGRRRQ